MARLDWRRRIALELWAAEHLHKLNVQPPDDWPDASRLRTNGIMPVYCGEYAPGLTGLYSILNGLRLLLAEVSPLKPSDEQALLEAGCKFMCGREALMPQRGLRAKLLIRMAEAMAFALSRRRGVWIQCERLKHELTNGVKLQPLFERTVVAKGAVLVLLGHGRYSVLRGYTQDSWLLFDATGRQWMLRQKKIGIAMPKPILMLSRSH